MQHELRSAFPGCKPHAICLVAYWLKQQIQGRSWVLGSLWRNLKKKCILLQLAPASGEGNDEPDDAEETCLILQRNDKKKMQRIKPNAFRPWFDRLRKCVVASQQ